MNILVYTYWEYLVYLGKILIYGNFATIFRLKQETAGCSLAYKVVHEVLVYGEGY